MSSDWFRENQVSIEIDNNNRKDENSGGLDGLKTKLAQEVAGNIYESTKSQAKGFLNIYANIDLIKPYFEVEVNTVLWRLFQSFIPRTTSDLLTKSADLYGPVMLIFTLISILLLGMKLSHTTVQEGTLMGTAFIICYTYWIFTSLFYYFLGYILSMKITLLQFLAITGYGLFGVCISLLVHCFLVGTLIDHLSVLFAGGLSSLSLGVLIFSNTPNKQNGAFFGIFASCIQFLFLLYLKMYYVSFYGAIASVM